MFNLFCGLGFVGADARINDAQTRALFQIAISPPRKRGEQAEETPPYWIPCVVFGERVQFAEKHVRKGAQILVEGALVPYQFLPEDSDTPLDRFEIRVSRIELIRPARRSGRDREEDEAADFEGS